MSAGFAELGQAVVALIASSRDLTTSGFVAMLSVTENMLRFVGAGVVADVGRLKEALLQRAEARTHDQQAAAFLKRVEAVKRLQEAAREANETKHASTSARRKKRKHRDDDVTVSPQQAIAIEQATEALREAISTLTQHGGGLLVEYEALQLMPDQIRDVLRKASATMAPRGAHEDQKQATRHEPSEHTATSKHGSVQSGSRKRRSS